MVYVINIDNKPLMPCTNVIARLLLKAGKAFETAVGKMEMPKL